ncbi:uncharacterized protein LOC130949267 [Arachis stenosperma]|uniref:uncharacterized protein LOC130949267 n=1 Tax=Arachis stenosperma TaxID=217475 RepID=UPI0025ABAE07|nr:uncharacterized protein LOC130949267 [Arachis stenosperma]
MNNETSITMYDSRHYKDINQNHLKEFGIEWYDFAVFGMVGVTIISSIWVLWMNEASSGAGACKNNNNTNNKNKNNNKSGDFEVINLDDDDDDENVLVMTTSRGNNKKINNNNNKNEGMCQLWTSCWKGVHPLWLLFTRFSSLVIMAVLVSMDVLDYDASIFFYYTEWTFTLVMIYFLMGTVASAYGCWQFCKKPPIKHEEMSEFLRRNSSQERISTKTIIAYYEETEPSGSFEVQKSRNVKDEFKQGVGFWVYVVQITYQTSAGAVVLTDTVFWGLIFPFMSISHYKLNMLIMGLMHSMNVVFLLLDTALNNLPFPFFRIAYFVLWSSVYIIFQWIIHACGFTWWPYPFLELNSPWSPFWYLGLGVIHFPCYALYSLIVKAKYAILSKLFPQAFLRS